jgi:hypothetical protein
LGYGQGWVKGTGREPFDNTNRVRFKRRHENDGIENAKNSLDGPLS